MNRNATRVSPNHTGRDRKRFLMAASALVLAATLWAGQESESESASSGAATPYLASRDFSQSPREAVVGTRAAKDRSFFGAPPPVSHSLQTERSSAYCLQCHALENRIEKRHKAIAPVPHAEFSQCMQCHVSGRERDVPAFRENLFVGLDFPGKGSRANDYAPPTIPHKTFMRENCLSCHGVTGDFAIKTPHPIRSQCRQCHAPEAAQDYTRPVF